MVGRCIALFLLVLAAGGSGSCAPSVCDPNYEPCVPVAADVDCPGGGGNGPAFASGPVTVVGRDVYDLDHDGDGMGCDS